MTNESILFIVASKERNEQKQEVREMKKGARRDGMKTTYRCATCAWNTRGRYCEACIPGNGECLGYHFQQFQFKTPPDGKLCDLMEYIPVGPKFATLKHLNTWAQNKGGKFIADNSIFGGWWMIDGKEMVPDIA